MKSVSIPPLGAAREGILGGEYRQDRTYATLRPQGSGDWLMILTCGGAGFLTSTSGAGPTHPGEINIYPPGEPQNYRTEKRAGRWHLLWAHFIPRPSWHPWLRWPLGAHGVRSLRLDLPASRRGCAAAMRRMTRLTQRPLPNAHEFAYNALEEALLWTQVGASRERWAQADTRVRRAMEYLAAHLRQPFHLEALARHCAISASRLAHLFKEQAGLSTQQYFEQQRMAQASRLLARTALPVGQVAAEVGYEDPFYFSNRFRRYAGCSPSQFRRKRQA